MFHPLIWISTALATPTKSYTNFPSSDFFASYGFNEQYLHYILPWFELDSDCIQFKTDDNQYFESELAVSNRIDPFNFQGNLTFHSSELHITFKTNNKYTKIPTLNATIQQRIELDDDGTSEDDHEVGKILNDLLVTGNKSELIYIESPWTSLTVSGNFLKWGSIYTGDSVLKNIVVEANTQIRPIGSKIETLVSLINVTRITSEPIDKQYIIDIVASEAKFVINHWNVTSKLPITGTSLSSSFSGSYVHATMCGIEEAVQNIKLTSSIIGLILCAILAISAYFLFRRVLEKPNVFSRFIRSRLGISPNERNPVNGTPTIVVVPSNDDLELAPLDEKQKNSNLSQLFLEKYPQGNEVYDLPPTSISMQPLRLYTDFPFEGDQPKVVLGPNISGKQFIRFETTEICSIQCNLPVLNVDKSANSFDPPPAFDSDDITELDYSKTIGSYYEVKIVRLPTSSTSMAFGYASQPCPPFRLPGWDPYSIAYHTKTGLVFSSEKPFGINCGPTLCEGDTLGVGYTKVDQRYHFYFIVNRKRMALQVDYPIVDKVTLYPTIGTGWDCELLVNFGN